jgi:hypothetical protein
MRHQVDEAAEGLRMGFDVPAPRPAADGAARPLDGLPEGRHHVLAQVLDELAREGALAGGDPVAHQRFEVRLDEVRLSRGGGVHAVSGGS